MCEARPAKRSAFVTTVPAAEVEAELVYVCLCVCVTCAPCVCVRDIPLAPRASLSINSVVPCVCGVRGFESVRRRRRGTEIFLVAFWYWFSGRELVVGDA